MEDYQSMSHTRWQCKYHTVSRDTEVIRRYIRDQEAEDQRLDQLEFPIDHQRNKS